MHSCHRVTILLNEGFYRYLLFTFFVFNLHADNYEYCKHPGVKRLRIMKKKLYRIYTLLRTF